MHKWARSLGGKMKEKTLTSGLTAEFSFVLNVSASGVLWLNNWQKPL